MELIRISFAYGGTFLHAKMVSTPAWQTLLLQPPFAYERKYRVFKEDMPEWVFEAAELTLLFYGDLKVEADRLYRRSQAGQQIDLLADLTQSDTLPGSRTTPPDRP